MGKASRWFRGLLGMRKSECDSARKPPKEKRRWSFVKSYREEEHRTEIEHKNHVIDNATARKALRALKGLVKLQAMVRGHIERKRTAEWLRKMQSTLLRAQARASAVRNLQTSYSSAKSSTCHGPATPEKFESPVRSKSMKYEQSPLLKRNCSKSCVLTNGNQESQLDEQSWNKIRSLTRTYSRNDEKSDRILEIDSGKPHFTSKRRSLFYSTSDAFGSDHYYSNSLTTTTKESTSGQSLSCEVQSNSPLKFKEVEESPFCTADNSPQYLSATSKDDGSKRSPFTPTRSDGSRSYLRGYDYPSYMAYTESSKAKVRSLSAPKQRPQYEKSGSSNRYSLNGFDGSRFATQKTSATLHASFTSKAYPGSGRLDKLGMPVGYRY
ncbi:IQ motif, EF-hand binding site [Sesbania bispinosa]|nr:IQ motif, EF-hand binding site [Sesbania bispinosa]